MLLQLTTTHQPATDLGFLLAKNPTRVQKFDISCGAAHVFYPIAQENQCTAALLLEIDPVGLVRGKNGGEGLLDAYVNDRPYAATSFLSVAIAQVLRSALNGDCKEKPELAQSEIPLQIQIESVPASAQTLQKLFAPLDYEIEVEAIGARHSRLILRKTARLSEILSHIYVLLPVLDAEKHYYIADDEVDKLLRRGAGWLEAHPERDWIVSRYLKRKKHLIRLALERLSPPQDEETDAHEEEIAVEKPLSLHQIRIQTVAQTLKESGARSVLDLGCGEGRLLRELLADSQFERIVGLDVSHRALDIAQEKLRLDRLPERQAARLNLIHGALTYRDERLKGFDAVALVEVIEHLDPARLRAFERVVWEFARPKTIVLTTPNAEFNVHWPSLPAGKLRHRDHRFEWTRAQFAQWAQKVAEKFGYEAELSPLGPQENEIGAPSQMAVFRLVDAL